MDLYRGKWLRQVVTIAHQESAGIGGVLSDSVSLRILGEKTGTLHVELVPHLVLGDGLGSEQEQPRKKRSSRDL